MKNQWAKLWWDRKWISGFFLTEWTTVWNEDNKPTSWVSFLPNNKHQAVWSLIVQDNSANSAWLLGEKAGRHHVITMQSHYPLQFHTGSWDSQQHVSGNLPDQEHAGLRVLFSSPKGQTLVDRGRKGTQTRKPVQPSSWGTRDKHSIQLLMTQHLAFLLFNLLGYSLFKLAWKYMTQPGRGLSNMGERPAGKVLYSRIWQSNSTDVQ